MLYFRRANRSIAAASKTPDKEAVVEGSDNGVETAEAEESAVGWGVLNAQDFDAPFDVPWGAGTVVFGMVLWAVGFVSAGFIALLLEAKFVGPEALQSASADVQSEFFLLNQVLDPCSGKSFLLHRVICACRLPPSPS